MNTIMSNSCALTEYKFNIISLCGWGIAFRKRNHHAELHPQHAARYKCIKVSKKQDC